MQNKKVGRREPPRGCDETRVISARFHLSALQRRDPAVPVGLEEFLSSGYTIRASPLRPTSGAKYSARLRVPDAQLSPWLQIGTYVHDWRGGYLSYGWNGRGCVRDWALKTCHCAVALLALVSLVPQKAIFTRPVHPAEIHGPIAVLLPAPLFTRTGVVMCHPDLPRP